jgi:hypothetical protein
LATRSAKRSPPTRLPRRARFRHDPQVHVVHHRRSRSLHQDFLRDTVRIAAPSAGVGQRDGQQKARGSCGPHDRPRLLVRFARRSPP